MSPRGDQLRPRLAGVTGARVVRAQARINRDFDRQEPGYVPKRLSASALGYVRGHAWPGNVRQLYNTLAQAAVLTDGDVIERRDIDDAVAEVPGGQPVDLLGLPLGGNFSLERHLEEVQRHYLRRAMEDAGGVQRRAAELLGYPYRAHASGREVHPCRPEACVSTDRHGQPPTA